MEVIRSSIIISTNTTIVNLDEAEVLSATQNWSDGHSLEDAARQQQFAGVFVAADDTVTVSLKEDGSASITIVGKTTVIPAQQNTSE